MATLVVFQDAFYVFYNVPGNPCNKVIWNKSDLTDIFFWEFKLKTEKTVVALKNE